MPFNDQNETEFHVHSWRENGLKKIVAHAREMPNFKARLATALIEKWGLVAAKPDGEDSAGRAKLVKLSPTELVTEAVETADIAVDEFRTRGWMLETPPIENDPD